MDQLGLQGDHTITFGPGQLAGIEMIVCLSAEDARFNGNAAALYTYDLTMDEGNVAGGGLLVISANQLIAGETLTLDASAETDGGRYTVYSGDGDDTLVGSAGADEIHGADGDDAITGGLGADDLRGDAGNDTFVYLATADSTSLSLDELLDFATGDLIGLTAIDAVAGGGDNAFSFIGSAAFTSVAGQLRAELQSGSTWLVEGDVNGDGTADLAMLVTSDHALAAGDFLL
jgi:Ca2+-binding RTX toxin-like protein